MNPKKFDNNAQMMTLEALIAALLIIASVLFVVSQAPSHIQHGSQYSEVQLKHYGEDVIDILKGSPSPDEDYDNLLQYYISKNKYNELDDFLNDTLPDNVGYNVVMYSGNQTQTIVWNGHPTEDTIAVSEIIATKSSSFGWVGAPQGVFVTGHDFSNRSLIIPMDDKQNNNMTAYNLVMKIAGLNVPVYQLLQDPRGSNYGTDWYWNITTTDDPWGSGDNVSDRRYAGGPYVVDADDLTPSIRNQIKIWADNPITVASANLNKLEFSSNMTNKNITITFTLNDSSSRVINLSSDDTDIYFVNSTFTGNNSEFLEINTNNVGFKGDTDYTKIVGIVMVNNALHDLTISNITVEWMPEGGKLIKIEIENQEYKNDEINPQISPAECEINYTIIYKTDPDKQVTVHESRQPFTYKYTTFMAAAPRIAVYPKEGSLATYYSNSGVPYIVLSNANILSGELENYDILTLPHEELDSNNMPDNVVKKVIDWVSNGGVVHAECASLDSLDQRVEDVDGTNHSWFGFIGVEKTGNSNTIQFIGNTTAGDTTSPYNDTANPGAPFNPLAQVYTVDGTLQGIEGATKSFILNQSSYNPNVNIMAVPLKNSSTTGDYDYPDITYIEAPFDKGTVIYLGGHDQSVAGQQRERIIFNTFMYSVTAKVYAYGLSEIRITMWYK